jgi:formylglycine-generating enzyme required for sulfatase activity
VTVALYREIMGGDPPSNAEAREPVVNMNWDDAVRFCNALSEREGYRPCYHRNVFRRWRCDWRVDGYRLPTEAEWEFACRAGTKTRYGFGNDPDELDAYGWYTENANGPQPVAAKRPNRWGLYDMHGNVWEWCWDRYGSYSPRPRKNPRRPTRLYVRSLFGRRVVRGGSFVAPPESLRSANRVGNLLPTRNCLGVQTAPRSICSKNPSGSSLAQPGG